MNPKTKERRADRKAGRVYGGNDGLAFRVMRGTSIQKSVKNRQGGLKLFSVLTFWLLLGRAKIAIAIIHTDKKQITGE
jgi:hypothetical protein